MLNKHILSTNSMKLSKVNNSICNCCLFVLFLLFCKIAEFREKYIVLYCETFWNIFSPERCFYILQLPSTEATRRGSFRFSEKCHYPNSDIPISYFSLDPFRFLHSFPGKLFQLLFVSIYHARESFIPFSLCLYSDFLSLLFSIKKTEFMRIISDITSICPFLTTSTTMCLSSPNIAVILFFN